MRIENFGQWLMVARKEANVTQEELGRGIGTGHSTISRIENGQTRPSRAQAVQVARMVTDDFEEINAALDLLGYSPEPPARRRGRKSAAASQVRETDPHYLPTDKVASSHRVLLINRAYDYARFTLGAVGGGSDLEVDPPAHEFDEDGIDDRLGFIRTIEEQHGLKLLPDEIS